MRSKAVSFNPIGKENLFVYDTDRNASFVRVIIRQFSGRLLVWKRFQLLHPIRQVSFRFLLLFVEVSVNHFEQVNELIFFPISSDLKIKHQNKSISDEIYSIGVVLKSKDVVHFRLSYDQVDSRYQVHLKMLDNYLVRVFL